MRFNVNVGDEITWRPPNGSSTRNAVVVNIREDGVIEGMAVPETGGLVARVEIRDSDVVAIVDRDIELPRLTGPPM